MRLPGILLAVFLGCLSLETVQAQSSKVTKSRYHSSIPKVRGKKAKAICPVFTNSRHPFHAVGLKLGDPLAITYKYYANRRLAFTIDVGKAASGLYNEYFRDEFNTGIQDTSASSGSGPTYVAHRVKSDFVAEGRVLYQVDVNRLIEGLQFYIGAGWEWRRTELRYDYEYVSSEGQADPFGIFNRSRVTMGPQITAGIEYSYFTIPVAAFMEMEYFTDIQADPGWQRFQGGVGLRYVF